MVFAFLGSLLSELDWGCRAQPDLEMEKAVAPKTYFCTCIALLMLLAATWATAYVDLGPFNLIVALGVAISKAIVLNTIRP